MGDIGNGDAKVTSMRKNRFCEWWRFLVPDADLLIDMRSSQSIWKRKCSAKNRDSGMNVSVR
jgi:hypothetical protein